MKIYTKLEKKKMTLKVIILQQKHIAGFILNDSAIMIRNKSRIFSWEQRYSTLSWSILPVWWDKKKRWKYKELKEKLSLLLMYRLLELILDASYVIAI